MELANAKIGYFPGSMTLDAPSDRRRFVRYAKSRGLEFEIASPAKSYDLVVLNQRADITAWSRYPRGSARIIYDATDSYISNDSRNWKVLLRGTSKFLTRQSKFLALDYRKAVEAMCRRADAVICSTDEQRQVIGRYCSNVHLILDMQDDDVSEFKTKYEVGRTLRFVWEGLASSGIPWKQLREIVDPLAARREVELHVVTDIRYHRYHDMYVRCHTVDDMRGVFGPLSSRVFLHQWGPYSLARIATGCDIALIPIDMADKFQCGKPENKLLLFWRLGLPTVVSATPAYVRAMSRCTVPLACHGSADWRSMIEMLESNEAARKNAGEEGRRIAQDAYGTESMLQAWDAVFASI